MIIGGSYPGALSAWFRLKYPHLNVASWASSAVVYPTMDMWKFGDRKNYTSLDLLAALFDIRSSKKDMDGSMVNHVYHIEKDLDKISSYCRDDVIVLAQLFLKLKNLPDIDTENITVV